MPATEGTEMNLPMAVPQSGSKRSFVLVPVGFLVAGRRNPENRTHRYDGRRAKTEKSVLDNSAFGGI
jgi:hypothetical protein